MNRQRFNMFPSSFQVSSNSPNRFWPSTFGENSQLPAFSTIHGYENQSRQPIIRRNFIDLSKNKGSHWNASSNTIPNYPFRSNVELTNVEFDTNNSKSVPSVRPFNKSEVLKIVLITIGCFLGLCIVPAVIAVPIILKTSTVSYVTSVPSTISVEYDVPTGTILLYAGNSLSLPGPTDRWLLCNGSAVSRVNYSNLFTVIGTTFGSGNGINTFNLPDFRSRFPMGSINNTLSTGGNSTHILTESQLPAHTHDHGSLMTNTVPAHTHVVNDPGHDHGGTTGSSGVLLSFAGTGNVPYASGGSFTLATHTHSISTDTTGISLQTAGNHTHTINGTTGSVGLGQPFNTIPPYQTVHYIIRT